MLRLCTCPKHQQLTSKKAGVKPTFAIFKHYLELYIAPKINIHITKFRCFQDEKPQRRFSYSSPQLKTVLDEHVK